MNIETGKKYLIMLVGVPGCGKSNWADHILDEETSNEEWKWTTISLDNIIEEMGAPEGLSYAEAFEKYSSVAARKMKERTKEAFKNRDNVVWDQTNLTVKGRRKKLKQVPEEYTKIAQVFEISPDELERRRTKRIKETGKTVPGFVMENMRKSYARPTKEEGFAAIFVHTQ